MNDDPPLKMRFETQSAMATLVSMALSVLTERFLVLLSMMLAFSLFAWAAVDGSTPKIVTASLFTVLVFLPVLWTSRNAVKE